MRDFGCYPSAQSAFYLNLGLETLAVRMKQYCENAKIVSEFLEANPNVESVNYPGLASNEYHELAQKYLPLGCSGVISFIIKGGLLQFDLWMRSNLQVMKFMLPIFVPVYSTLQVQHTVSSQTSSLLRAESTAA